MLISHKNKLITIDIPKTGTRSLRITLMPLGIIDIIGSAVSTDFPQHGTALECKQSLENLGYNFDDYFSFCVVRNPWDRYLSFFKYFKEKADEYIQTSDYSQWHDVKINQGKTSVRLFSEGSEQDILRKIINSQTAQSEYFLNNNQKIMISHIGDFTNLEKEWNYLFNKIKIDKPQTRHENKSLLRISCSDIYNQELIDLVAEKENYLINLKKYEFK